ncbi:MAG: hypothetical protein Q7J25_11305 [Vicinamibacterales bacterium]|nr:hypothetical protein [Vicinamibacterales bacterium]
MAAGRLRTPYALLTRHFLRQFLENDLISPDADRSQLLAVVGSMLLSLTLFVSVFLSANYITARFTPGQAAIRSLDDKFFYLELAMIVTALVAASQWDALAIDSRDGAILEPLPVPASTIRRAKLSAVAILGAAVAIGATAIPSVVFPWLLSFGFRQMSVVALLPLMATHAIVTVAAAAFGYLTVVALREAMAAVLGPRWFPRVSPWAQGALIVVLGSSLLLLAPTADRIGQRGFDGWRALTPPMWFLGAYELAAGGIVADLPRSTMTTRQAGNDEITSTLYRERRAQFPAMVRRAGLAIGLTFLVAAAAYLWNARRLPSLAPAPPAFRRRWRLGERLANALLVRNPSARAGFHFTLAAIWRSNTHRLTLACAAAVGFAMAVLALSNANAQQGVGPSTRLLSMQPLLYGALLVGFRHVIRVPAELRANWGFQLAWRGRERAFLDGVKYAAVVALVIPALAVLLPLFVFVLGPQRALMHAALGLAGAIVLLEALMLNYDKVPFTCTYVPSENMKALAPIYAVAFLIGASRFARMQNDALASGSAISALLTLAVLFAILRVWSLKRARLAHVEFDEAPATYQRLGLDA